MLRIGKINYVEEENTARIESIIQIDGREDFTLHVQTERQWGEYLVTDRVDAFLVGLLMYALVNKHDIVCEAPVTSKLLFSLETYLIPTLTKHEERFYRPKITAETIDEPVPNAGAVGTGISLGLDSFCTIADMYNHKLKPFRLTHLATFNSGVLGGYYQKNNWDFCAKKLYDREVAVAEELGLPLVSVSTNLTTLMKLKTDYYITYLSMTMLLSLGKLFGTYFISSMGKDFSCFHVENTYQMSCDHYDLLTMYCCSVSGGIQFLSGGGEKDRCEKMLTVRDFPIARKNLQSCLTEYYNCMKCVKCKRNLVTMDALGILDEFREAYDIDYYLAHREEYIRWMCEHVSMETVEGNFIKPAYDLLEKREPELIHSCHITMGEAVTQMNEFHRQRDVYRDYAIMFRKLMSKPNWENKLKMWFADREIKRVVLYNVSESSILLSSLRSRLGIEIPAIIEDVKPGAKQTGLPRLPENTIDYPACDAVIICNLSRGDIIARKLRDFLSVPIYDIHDVLELK